ncbi:MAG: sodium:calcium antiporter [Bdellovibrionaceae bacterium]|nr:sodium:calcium antiporter [Pseudobdellovibrionaceae bacterium]
MVISLLLLLLGFALLALGAERLLEGCLSLSARYNIPHIIVGLVIISICTSAPEFFSSLKATYTSPDIALSNVLGSNIFNILGILGISSLLRPINTRPLEYVKELVLLIFSGVVLMLFLNKNLFFKSPSPNHYIITQVEGGILLLILISSLLYTALKSKKVVSTAFKLPSIFIELGYIALGIVLLIMGSRLAINHSIILARWLGWSESFIGLTLVGVATGLPELITSIVAIYKKHSSIAIGGIVGSNLFNLLAVLGGVSLIHPIAPTKNITHLTDLLVSILAAVLLLFTMLYKTSISRITGIIYLCLYISFIAWRL